MNSREKILQAVAQNKPTFSPLPDTQDFSLQLSQRQLLETFQNAVQQSAGKVVNLDSDETLANVLQIEFPDAISIASTSDQYQGNLNLHAIHHPVDLEQVDVAVIPSTLGVAENGAVWLTEQDCQFRVLPFIAQHLVVVLSAQQLVENMHQAYQRISIDATGYGVFVAGPSKTADIEQSLVIGAQAARSLTIVLTP